MQLLKKPVHVSNSNIQPKLELLEKPKFNFVREDQSPLTPFRTVVFDFISEKPISDYYGLMWTDALHKRCVKVNLSEKFIGFENGHIQKFKPSEEKVWFLWDSSHKGNIKSLRVVCPQPFTEQEFDGLRSIDGLWIYNEKDQENQYAQLKMSGVDTEWCEPSTQWETVSPVLLYTNTRSIPGTDIPMNQRSCEGQVANLLKFHFADDPKSVIKFSHDDFTIDENHWMSCVIPGHNNPYDVDFEFRVKVMKVYKDVWRKRGKRESPFFFGFKIHVESEIPLCIPSLSFASHFGAGRLVKPKKGW